MNLRKQFVAGIACLVAASQAFGAQCEGDSIDVPDSATLASVLSLAEAGDTHAQAQVGEAYFRGRGIEHDVRKAYSWLEKSAAGGSSEGQYLLGRHLVERAASTNSRDDYKVAADWLRRSADHGCIPSLAYLGVLTKQGNGVQKNTEAGIEMITKAAEAGLIPAQMVLGGILLSGDGVEKDIESGFYWMKRAADAGDSSAEIIVASLYLQGEGMEKKPDLGISMLKSIISRNDSQSPKAAYMLGVMYMEVKGVPLDRAQALEAMLLAANSNIADSEARLKMLTNNLPKQKLPHSCSVFRDQYFVTNNAKEHLLANEGEMVILIGHHEKSAEVYFPERRLIGFVLLSCIAR